MTATCRTGEGEAPWRWGAQTVLTAGHGGCQPWQERRKARKKSSCQFERKESNGGKAATLYCQDGRKLVQFKVDQPDGLTKWPFSDAPWYIMQLETNKAEFRNWKCSSFKAWKIAFMSQLASSLLDSCNLTCRRHRKLCLRSCWLLRGITRYKPNKGACLHLFFSRTNIES